MEHLKNIPIRAPPQAPRRKGALMLLRRIETFLRHSGMPWTKFGRLVAHDPRLVGDMRNGRVPRDDLARRIEAFIDSHAQPKEADHAL
jgi:hypothetical protein